MKNIKLLTMSFYPSDIQAALYNNDTNTLLLCKEDEVKAYFAIYSKSTPRNTVYLNYPLFVKYQDINNIIDFNHEDLLCRTMFFDKILELLCHIEYHSLSILVEVQSLFNNVKSKYNYTTLTILICCYCHMPFSNIEKYFTEVENCIANIPNFNIHNMVHTTCWKEDPRIAELLISQSSTLPLVDKNTINTMLSSYAILEPERFF